MEIFPLNYIKYSFSPILSFTKRQYLKVWQMIILLFVSGIVNSVKEAQDKNKKKWYFPCLCIVVGLFSFCQDRNSEIRTEEKISRLYEISQDAIEIEDLSYDELHERLHDIKYELDNFISDYYEQQPREDDRY